MIASDFTTMYRTAVRDLYDARKRLKSLAELAPPILALVADGPLAGANADIAKADLAGAITAAGQLETYLTDFAVNPNVPTAINVSLQKLL